jgi:hypothetical protein
MIRTFLRLAALLALGIALFLGGAFYGAAPAADDPPDARLKQLLREKQQLRKQAAEMIRRLQATGGGATAVEVIEAHLAALRAELDAAETREERIAALEKIVAEEKRREQMLMANVKGLSAMEQIDLKVRRLDAEIALERARLD